MNITLTPEQENIIKTKLQTGKYRNVEQVLEIALRLLDEYERSSTQWTEDVKAKINAAISLSEQTPPIDGENFINQIITKFQ